jgi:prefoldin subunit 5
LPAQIEALIDSLEAELAYYNERIQNVQERIANLQDSSNTQTEEQQLEELFECDQNL